MCDVIEIYGLCAGCWKNSPSEMTSLEDAITELLNRNINAYVIVFDESQIKTYKGGSNES
jgi:hypothetical protein